MTVIQMSDRELTRLRVMIDLGDGRLTLEAAGTLMGIGRRQVFRPLLDGLVAQAVLHAADVRGIKSKAVALHQPGVAVLAIHEFITEAGLECRVQAQQVAA